MPEQLDAMIAKNHRDVKTSRMGANRRRMLECINAACPVCHVSSDCIRYAEASQAEQLDAVQRQQMERARDHAMEGTDSEDTGFFRKIHKIFRKTVKTFRKTGKCTIRPVTFPPRRI